MGHWDLWEGRAEEYGWMDGAEKEAEVRWVWVNISRFEK